MSEPKRIRLPMTAEDARALQLGDTVLIDGEIVVSAGLPTYQRIAEQPRHAANRCRWTCRARRCSTSAPTPATRADGSVEVLYLNPTTSTRFNPLMPGIVRGLGLHAVGGKGGLDAACAEALREVGCVYLSFPGGGCPLLSDALRAVLDVGWREMLTHYRLVRLAVQGLGPATVAIDAHGNSLYAQIAAQAQQRLPQIAADMGAERYAPPHMPALPPRP